MSADSLTYVFKLQSGVSFHDGKQFSAEDAVFSIMKFLVEVSARSRAIFQRIDSCVASDANTVVIKLKAPSEPFLLMFDSTTCAIIPKHVHDGSDYRNNPANQTPIGTGAFSFAEWQRGNFIRLVRGRSTATSSSTGSGSASASRRPVRSRRRRGSTIRP